MQNKLFRIYNKCPSEVVHNADFMDAALKYELWRPSLFKLFQMVFQDETHYLVSF